MAGGGRGGGCDRGGAWENANGIQPLDPIGMVLGTQPQQGGLVHLGEAKVRGEVWVSGPRCGAPLEQANGHVIREEHGGRVADLTLP